MPRDPEMRVPSIRRRESHDPCLVMPDSAAEDIRALAAGSLRWHRRRQDLDTLQVGTDGSTYPPRTLTETILPSTTEAV